MFFVGSYDPDLELDIDPFFFVIITHSIWTYTRLSCRFRRFFLVFSVDLSFQSSRSTVMYTISSYQRVRKT
jgi:hypothetical protein